MKWKPAFFAMLFATLLRLTTGAPLMAQTQGLLPPSFGSWTAPAPSAQVSAGQIAQFAGDKAAILHEYGVSGGERRDYAQGGMSVTATLYRMTDPTAAFGAFTFLRTSGMAALAPGKAAAYAAASPDHALFVAGNLVVDVSPAASSLPQATLAETPAPKSSSSLASSSLRLSRPSDAELNALANVLLPRADRRPYPDIPDYLPQAGLEHGTEHYVLGPLALAQVFPVNGPIPRDWIGFDKSAEGIVARYHLPGQPKDQAATLLLVLYPTQQIASEQYAVLPKWFSLNPNIGAAIGASPQPDAAAAIPSNTPTNSPLNKGPVIFGTRSSALVAVLSGVDSLPAARTFLDQIHYASAVTWNEPSHELTDPSIGTIVVGAFMDTGSIMVLAIAAGIGFGGFRLLIKLILPGKVFDSNASVEILQLGLTSKPIRAGDFYSLQTPKS
jgi:hypothetical protein